MSGRDTNAAEPIGSGHARADLARSLTSSGLDWIVPAWNGTPRVRALFTTRNGGASAGPQATLDLGTAQPTEVELRGAIGENRRRLRRYLPSDPVWLAQVHGCDVVAVGTENVVEHRAVPPRADAAITRMRGIVLTVRTADCLPVLLAARDGGVLGVAHAGWRGLAAGVLEATIAAMGVQPDRITAWLGPAIGPRSFEVGADVHGANCVRDPGAEAHFTPLCEGKWLADLPALARRRLAAAGVVDVAIDGACTFADSARFFSYRRDRLGGRMALAAWLALA
jgi:YfiH family protein